MNVLKFPFQKHVTSGVLDQREPIHRLDHQFLGTREGVEKERDVTSADSCKYFKMDKLYTCVSKNPFRYLFNIPISQEAFHNQFLRPWNKHALPFSQCLQEYIVCFNSR